MEAVPQTAPRITHMACRGIASCVLTDYSISHEFEVYPGAHTSNVANRFQVQVIPFFSRTLAFDQKRLQRGKPSTKGGK
jgi:hypothetical protein